MKIKTITCHEVYNYGASLQEYALLKYLQEQGHQAETIHYKPPFLSNHFKLWTVSSPFFAKNIFLKGIYIILKLPKRLINRKRKRSFDRFSEKYIPATKTLYTNNDQLKKNLPLAEAYICGSDQIWNSFFENGKDPAFYLDFVPEDKLKVSYAASFAIDKLDESIAPFVKRMVSNIDHVSVRESSGKMILQELGIQNVTQVLDPVFLLDSHSWIPIMDLKTSRSLVGDGNYMVVYDFDCDPLIKSLAVRLQAKYDWNIVAFNELIDYADKNLYLHGPEVFLAVLKNAKCILANSFHAVAYSIIFKKELAVFNRNYKINTRMRDLLESVGLQQLLLTDQEGVNGFSIGSIDYNKVDAKLDPLIQKSKDFLLDALTA